MKISLITTILILGTFITSFSQVVTDTPPVSEKLKYSIGVGAGFATGYGLSFKYNPNKLGVQLNFAPFKNKTTSRYSLGVTFLYNLIEAKYTKLYIYQANHFYYNSVKYETEIFNGYGVPNTKNTSITTENYFNNGLGFGFEIVIAKNIGLNLMTGYAFYDNFNGMNITGESALYYKF